MKNVKINRLWYNNFRGQSRELVLKDRNIVSGRNRSGKSTCLNAIMMLLTDADNTDRTKFGMFDDTKAAFSKEDAQICTFGAEFDINGTVCTLQKTASQKWTRARGSTEYTKADSDEYKYFIDGVEISASKYQDFVTNNFAPVGKLKLMLNIDLWRSLDWATLRKHFGDIVGEINVSDFQGDYTDILSEIQAGGVQAAKDKFHKLISNSDRSYPGYNEQMRDLEAAIKANEDTLPYIGGVPAAERRIAELNAELELIDEKMLGLKGLNDDAIAKRRDEEQAIAAVELDLKERKAKHDAARRELETAILQTGQKNKINAERRATLKKTIADLSEMLELQKQLREEKLNELDKVLHRQFDGNCPFCGTELTGELKAARVKEFTAKRDSDRAYIIEQGKGIKARIDEYTEKIKAAEEQLAAIIKDESALELERKYMSFPKWEETKECAEMTARIREMRDRLTPIPESPDATALLTRKGEIRQLLTAQYEITSLETIHDEIRARIEQFKARLKSVVAAKAECERKELLCAQYLDEEARIIRERTNKFFPEGIEVVMQKRKKNGEYAPCCEMRINGVNGLNAGHERWMQIGVAISKAFMRYYDESLPLLIDDTEGIDPARLPEHEGQVILAQWADCDFCIKNA